jgi:hypothetical protein
VAEQLAVLPPFVPAHDHVQALGPVTTLEAVPALHKSVGKLVSMAPFDAPHTPLTAGGLCVVEVKPADTPPIVTVEVILVLYDEDEVWRTHKV